MAMSYILNVKQWVMAFSDDGNVKEYCSKEQFEASCGSSAVIVMQSAFFGRLRIGKCVRKDLGYVGCQVDVQSVIDKLCSGEHDCSFLVSKIDTMISFNRQNCLEELKSHLQASYTCVPVINVDSSYCQSSETVLVTASSGYFSSLSSMHPSCGAGATPWLIQVSPGQKINITLLDFATYEYQKDLYSSNPVQKPCHAYAILKERDVDKTFTICGGAERIRNIYVTETNNIEIRLFSRKHTSESPQFLIKYSAVGCETPMLGSLYTMNILGNTLEVTCSISKERWKLQCIDGVYKGKVGNCSLVFKPQEGKVVIGGVALSLELSIALITIIATLISIIILVIGVICIRRRRHNELESRVTVDLIQPKEESKLFKPRASIHSTVANNNNHRDNNEYARIVNMPLPAPPPSLENHYPETSSRDALFNQFNAFRQNSLSSQGNLEHTYSYDAYEPSLMSPPNYCDDPRYFELDPEVNIDPPIEINPRLPSINSRPFKYRSQDWHQPTI